MPALAPRTVTVKGTLAVEEKRGQARWELPTGGSNSKGIQCILLLKISSLKFRIQYALCDIAVLGHQLQVKRFDDALQFNQLSIFPLTCAIFSPGMQLFLLA